jgi:hypothetical protein
LYIQNNNVANEGHGFIKFNAYKELIGFIEYLTRYDLEKSECEAGCGIEFSG